MSSSNVNEDVKFKVGDSVRIINSNGGSGHKVGDIVTLTKVEDQTFLTADKGCFDATRCVLVAPPVDTPLTDGWIPWSGGECPVLPKMKVTFKRGDGIVVERYLAMDATWGKCVHKGHEIVAYKLYEEVPAVPYEFQVGDIVEFVEDYGSWHKGDRGVISSGGGSDNMITVRKATKNDAWCFSKRVKLINPVEAYPVEKEAKLSSSDEATKQANKPEKSMKKVMKFTTSQHVNGVDVTSMNQEQLISTIAEAEGYIADLEKITVESKAIKKEITRLNAFIKKVVAVLDAK